MYDYIKDTLNNHKLTHINLLFNFDCLYRDGVCMSCARPAIMKTTNSAPMYCNMKDMVSLPSTLNIKKRNTSFQSGPNQNICNRYGYKYIFIFTI